MPAAIDRFCYVAAAPNASRKLRLVAGDLAEEAALDLDHLSPAKNWSDYVAGVAQVLAKAGIALKGADLLIESNVPIGAGLSSSAALEVAAALAFLALAGRDADRTQIARWAQKAENDFVGMPCGIMDQFASANGAAHNALLLDCRTLEHRRVRIPESAAFLLVNSMVPHAHTEGEYRRRRAECETAAVSLSVRALRDVPEEALPDALARLSGAPLKRCRHVVSENARVHKTAAALAADDLSTVGRLLNASHESLRDDMEVSVDAVDRLATIAQETAGVFGARMMGGGFGGCVLALVPANDAERIASAIAARYGAVIGREPDTLLCRAVDGAVEVNP